MEGLPCRQPFLFLHGAISSSLRARSGFLRDSRFRGGTKKINFEIQPVAPEGL